MNTVNANIQPATGGHDRVWKLKTWLALADMPRPTFYVLPADEKPRTCKRGRTVYVLESPREWAERIAGSDG